MVYLVRGIAQGSIVNKYLNKVCHKRSVSLWVRHVTLGWRLRDKKVQNLETYQYHISFYEVPSIDQEVFLHQNQVSNLFCGDGNAITFHLVFNYYISREDLKGFGEWRPGLISTIYLKYGGRLAGKPTTKNIWQWPFMTPAGTMLNIFQLVL